MPDLLGPDQIWDTLANELGNFDELNIDAVTLKKALVPVNLIPVLLAAYTAGKRSTNHEEIEGPNVPDPANDAQALVLWHLFTKGLNEELAPVPKIAKVADPEFYYGDMTKYQAFVSQCALRIASEPRAFQNDQSKMIFAISFLRGNAYSWAQPQIDTDTGHVKFEHYVDFLQALSAAFDDPDAKATATRKIYSLTQTTSCSAFYSQFFALTCRLGWTDPTYTIPLFEKGLKAHVKDALAFNGRSAPTNSLEAFANHCISLDNAFQARFADRPRHQPNPVWQQPTAKFPASAPADRFAAQQRHAMQTFAPVPNPGPAPAPAPKIRPAPRDPNAMEIDQIRVDAQEQRRRNRLCFYCGNSGHWIATCPDRRKARVNQTVAFEPSSLPVEEGPANPDSQVTIHSGPKN